MRAFVLATVLVLFPAPLLADQAEAVFHCGKDWITFTEDGDRDLFPTVRKSDIMSLWTIRRQTGGDNPRRLPPGRAVNLKESAGMGWMNNVKPGQFTTFYVTEPTWQLIIKCLN